MQTAIHTFFPLIESDKVYSANTAIFRRSYQLRALPQTSREAGGEERRLCWQQLEEVLHTLFITAKLRYINFMKSGMVRTSQFKQNYIQVLYKVKRV